MRERLSVVTGTVALATLIGIGLVGVALTIAGWSMLHSAVRP